MKKDLQKISIDYILIFLGCLAISRLLDPFWTEYPVFLHTALELTCVFIAFCSFFIIFYASKQNSKVNMLLGLGFIMVGIADLFHTFFYQGFSWHPQGYYDLSTRYWILGRFIEALVFLTATRKSANLNRYIGSFLALGLALGTCLLILSYPQMLPVLLIEDLGVTTAKVAAEYVIIALYLISIYLLAKDIRRGNSSPIQTYLLYSVLFAVPAEVSFTLYINVTDYYQVLGHILKIVCYYFIFKGIFESSITYPYRQLKTSQSSLHKLICHFPMGIATFDQNSELTYLNPRAREILSCGKEDFLGQSLASALEKLQIKPWDQGCLASTDRSKTKLHFCSLKNMAGKDYILSMEFYYLGESGFMYVFEDARKEQQLENLQIQTRTLLNSVSNIAAICDNNYEILLHNKALAELLEAEDPNFLGNNVKQLAARVSFNYTKKPNQDLSSNPSNYFEASCLSFKGAQKFVSGSYAPIYNVANEKIGFVFVASDITSREMLRKKMEQQEKLAILGQMAAGIVHEIKNPLTSIKGFNQMILERTQEDLTRDFSEIIAGEADALNRVITDFLAFAKPRKPLLREVSLNKLLSSIEDIIGPQLFLKGIDFQLNLSEKESMILADEGQLKQVILNIVKNAMEALESIEKPILTISLDSLESTKEMRICVKDNGKGISPQEKQKIGTPFFTTKEKGTGLGLSVCFQIIKENNGSISFDSEPRMGTAFQITLPWTKQNELLDLSDNAIA